MCSFFFGFSLNEVSKVVRKMPGNPSPPVCFNVQFFKKFMRNVLDNCGIPVVVIELDQIRVELLTVHPVEDLFFSFSHSNLPEAHNSTLTNESTGNWRQQE